MNRLPFIEGWTFEGQRITLPHDAMIRSERRQDAPSGSAQGYFAGGTYTYEKTFARPAAEKVILAFEGVYRNAHVLLNGQEIAFHAYGYTPFQVDLSDRLSDGTNALTVVCDNEQQPDSRWYAGAGIYRPVWLWTGSGAVLEPDSVCITTESTAPALIRVQTRCSEEVAVEICLEGKIVAESQGNDCLIPIPDAKLWDADHPTLYTCRVSSSTDSLTVSFGMRIISKSRDGLLVNWAPVKLRGGCIHHDSGILGSATYDEMEWRRIRMLKEAGFNAVRSAHNPISRAALEACDALGMYVMDESWDMWFSHKSRHDYASQWEENWKSDLRAMVLRDRNHPSVILYSIGNEVSEPVSRKGLEAEKQLVSCVHALDPSRPVTGGFNLMILSNAARGKSIYQDSESSGAGWDSDNAKKMSGMNSTLFNLITSVVGTGMNLTANSRKADKATSPALDLLDVAGYNYASGRYRKDGRLHPDRLIIGSETFPQDIVKNWRRVEEYPWLCGDFMWTAWDYLGEAGIGAWAYTEDGKGFNKPYPWLLADTGAMDILGNPTGELFLAQTVWHTGPEVQLAVQPVNHSTRPSKAVWRGTNAIPGWSWAGCDGKWATVEVYADADIAALMFNGIEIARKRIRHCRAVFRTRYAPGTLSAVTYDKDGILIGTAALTTAAGPLEVRLTGPGTVRRKEIIPICLDICDSEGVIERNRDEALTLSVHGGELLGFGSANPRTEDRYDSDTCTTYYGQAMAIVRAGTGDTLKLSVRPASLPACTKTIPIT